MGTPLVTVINCKDLSKPLTKMVEVVAQGIGGMWRPLGTIINAAADAKASLIHAEADIQKQELALRALARVGHVELRRQKNIEAIVDQAKAALPESVAIEPVSPDWITQFFNSAQDVSEAELQKLWSQILANEVAKPGSVSRRTLEFLKTMTKREAELFERLLMFTFQQSDGWRYIVSSAAVAKLLQQGIKEDVIAHLTDINLLGVVGNASVDKLDTHWFDYNNQRYYFKYCPPDESRPSDWPHYLLSRQPLTATGQELSQIIRIGHNDRYIQMLSSELEEIELKIEPTAS
jgi:hypothetical protein